MQAITILTHYMIYGDMTECICFVSVGPESKMLTAPPAKRMKIDTRLGNDIAAVITDPPIN